MTQNGETDASKAIQQSTLLLLGEVRSIDFFPNSENS